MSKRARNIPAKLKNGLCDGEEQLSADMKDSKLFL